MKTSELTGAALDWAVAKCEGVPVDAPDWNNKYINAYDYSTNWSQGGPIIERMKLNRLTTNTWGGYTASVTLTLINTDDDEYMVWRHGSGPTPLIAAMRCRVASKLGEEIDIPDELKEKACTT